MEEPRKIGLFGGTFDPVHHGHVFLAALARDALGLDEVRFIPCHQSPHKGGSLPTPGADRLEMLRLATAELPWAVVDDRELSRGGASFSYQTAGGIAAEHEGARLFWLLGGDQWRALPRWRRPEELSGLVEFIVLARGDDAPDARPGYRMHIVDGAHPASATAIREAVKSGTATPPWLHPDVAAWIARRGLYRG